MGKLLIQAKTARRISYPVIAQEARVYDESAIRHFVKGRRDSLHIQLADWILRNTIYGDPHERLAADLQAAGYDQAQTEALEHLLRVMRPEAWPDAEATIPVGTQIRRDRATGAKLYEPPPTDEKAGEQGTRTGEAPATWQGQLDQLRRQLMLTAGQQEGELGEALLAAARAITRAISAQQSVDHAPKGRRGPSRRAKKRGT